jgi:hypothetical protein
MLKVRNETPFEAGMFVVPDERGVDTLYVVAKATFGVRAGGEAVAVAEAQVPVCLADEFWGEAQTSSLKLASEAHLGHDGTDVLITGQLYAPRGRKVPTLDATLRVGPVRMAVRAFGDRTFTGASAAPFATAPQPFDVMPLRYERAFGGGYTDPGTREPRAERRNPVGLGMLPEDTRDLRAFRGAALPNLEDPAALWQRPGDRPAPCAPGPVAPTWLPRAQYVGTYDARWETHRAPYLPADFDKRYFRVAPPRLASEGPLRGGEPVELEHVTPEGAWRFALPTLSYEAHAVVRGRREALSFALQTVHLEPDDARLTLVHRAALPCDKRALAVETVHLALGSLSVPAGAA